jgi:hypothetical protein
MRRPTCATIIGDIARLRFASIDLRPALNTGSRVHVATADFKALRYSTDSGADPTVLVDFEIDGRHDAASDSVFDVGDQALQPDVRARDCRFRFQMAPIGFEDKVGVSLNYSATERMKRNGCNLAGWMYNLCWPGSQNRNPG